MKPLNCCTENPDMKEITIDCREIASRTDFHRAFAAAMSFPEWYGNNLDALYDLLTEHSGPLEIVLFHVEDMKKQLGIYGNTLLHTLQEAENDNLRKNMSLLMAETIEVIKNSMKPTLENFIKERKNG